MSDSLSPEAAANGSGLDKQQTQRARWATRRMTVKSSTTKRRLLLNRHNRKKSSASEKSAIGAPAGGGGDDGHGPLSTGDEPGNQNDDAQETDNEDDEDDEDKRTLFFNLPLPKEMVDEEGNPNTFYTRNKVRTAKYTPLSFIPKNLWFQFHNVANIFFLFVIILVIFPIFGSVNPGLSAVPLIVIICLTAVKDAIEDYRRTMTDIELNNAPVHRLMNWDNVNVKVGDISTWRKFKKANSRFFGGIWYAIQSLWSKQARKKRIERKTKPQENEEEPRPSVETQRTRMSMRQSLSSPFAHRDSTHEDIQMTPVPSPSPPSHIQIQEPDKNRLAAMQDMKTDIINYRRAHTNARFKKEAWKNLVVGDFVRLYSDDELPADVIILSTSDPDGACYVETKNLDGETNLKVRQALRCGRSLKHARDCERAEFVIESEAPQSNLYKFNGAIRWKQNIPGFMDDEPENMTEAITIDNLLLRGCNLRNTEWILGVVVYTGHDTKIMLNAGITPSKRARIAREMNFNVICNFGILFVMCFISAIINGAAWAKTDTSKNFFNFGSIGGSPPVTGFITFWAAIINFQNLVPISLYITLEIVRTLQAIFIFNDVEMYYEPIDQPCVPKTWNISDDVGQIEYIFSDKTGTLTQNVMEFKKATINGHPYGEAYTEAQAGMQKRLGVDTTAESERIHAEIAEAKARSIAGLRKIYDNPYFYDDALTFIAPDFVADLDGESGQEQKDANERFMLTLALCHSVIAEKSPGDPPRMLFKAQSPDEEALVATARDMGFTVLGSSGDGIDVNVMGEDRHYQILNTIEFNSTRKRMSSIVKMPDGRIIIFCKGADSVIYSRLKRGEQRELRQETAQHLEMFAREGLRTLCIAMKELTEEEYRSWKTEHDQAASALEDREEKLEAAAELIEQDFLLLGGTAIEDRLQDGVPDTIELLGQAGIKLWVLTGDKVETAINIGFSCNLLNNDMELINLKVDEEAGDDVTDDMLLDDLDKQISQHLVNFGMTGDNEDLKAAKKNHEPPGPTHGLVIDGFALRWALHDRLKQKFLLLCKQCRSVLCCRVSPAQKASVVAMVKNGLDVMTLSIGDGANDVAMIQEADVGVGIAGVEGRQAAMSSDYAIGQFRFLQRLVLVHGRWSYRRLAESIANFFYKNMVWVFGLLWYQIYCEFDITYLFEYSYIIMFNLFFTSVPVGVLGVLDQDVSDKVSLAVPELYRTGIERLEWTQKKFWLYMLDGVYQSVIAFYIPYLLFSSSRPITSNGLGIDDRYRFGAYVAHPAVVIINGYIMINSYRWDWLMLLIIVISDLFVFFWTGVYTSFTASDTFYKAGAQIYGEATFWACFIIVPVMCLLPRFGIKSIQKVFFPYDVDIIREQVFMGKFDHLKGPTAKDEGKLDEKSQESNGSSKGSSKKSKHMQYASIDDDSRPIYPPSTVTRDTNHGAHSQQGSSDTTNLTNRYSTDMPLPGLSSDRPRPSYDRMRASMDRTRASFEASNDFTSAARLSRIESSQSRGQLHGQSQGQSQGQSHGQSHGSNIRSRLRALSLTKNSNA